MKACNVFGAGLVLIAAAALSSASARADGGSGYAGVLLGPSFANSGIGTRFAVGGHIGSKITPNFSLGLYFTYENLASLSASSDGITATASADEYIIALEPNFYPISDLGLYLGAKLGVGITTASLSATSGGDSISGSDSITNFAGGPALGYMLQLAPSVSLGAEFNYIIVTTPVQTLQFANILASLNLNF